MLRPKICIKQKSGAFTGEISADMLQNVGVNIVILDIQNAEPFFNETDALIASKVNALEHDMTVIFVLVKN
jgi:triosephosphate isomerase